MNEILSWIKGSWAEKDGRNSSTRPLVWALGGWLIFSQAFTYFIIGWEYFVYHHMFDTNVILVLILGGSASSGGVGAIIYTANQYGNKEVSSPTNTVVGQGATNVQTTSPEALADITVPIENEPGEQGVE